MRHSQLLIASGFWLCVGSAIASAGSREAGLWEMTSTTTWQKAPSSSGPDGNPMKGGTHTTQVCLTQEMIDKFGALLPHSRGQCTISNKVIAPGTVSADYVCSGSMSGKGALQSTWSDNEHEKGSIHFVGTMQVGSESQPIEWTTESTTVFKSADCGGIKPAAMPKPAE